MTLRNSEGRQAPVNSHRDMPGSSVCLERQFLREWFSDYRYQCGIAEYFKAYKDEVLARHGRLPSQNFLLGSELLANHEVRWCRVLRWLLDPKACKEQGSAFQHALASLAGLPKLGEDAAVVKKEVANEDGTNRLDLLISWGKEDLVVEAKVGAVIDHEQLCRYRRDHSPTRVFAGLLIAHKTPSNMPLGWKHAMWGDVAGLLRHQVELMDESPTNHRDQVRWRVVAEDFIDVIQTWEA